MDDQVPNVNIPDYELLRPIGEGGFGRVWAARNRTTGHLRALKLVPLRVPGSLDPAGREIMSLTRLEGTLHRKHPNLLTIYHVGKTEEHLYYVMDLADDLSGKPAADIADYRPASLESLLQNGPLTSAECLRFAGQLLAGLASLHETGMVHRDVKPSNCLVVDGELKLADFGLLTEAGPHISRVGTRSYMPPDGRMDARADVYAAGLVIYEMVSGLPAQCFPRLEEQAGKVATNMELCSLIRLALGAAHPDPQKRFDSAPAMLAELESGPTSPAQRPMARRSAVLGLGIVALVLLAASIFFWPSEAPSVDVNVITHAPYFESTIYLDGMPALDPKGQPLRTPCSIEDVPARAHRVTLRHETMPDLDLGTVDFATTRQILVGDGVGRQ